MSSCFCRATGRPLRLGQSMLSTVAIQAPRSSRGAGGGSDAASDWAHAAHASKRVKGTASCFTDLDLTPGDPIGSARTMIAPRTTSAALALLMATSTGCSQDPQALRKKIGDVEPVGEWNYDDLEQGVRQAKKSGKPLFLVFRCVP